MKMGLLFSGEWEECKAKMPSLVVHYSGSDWRASWSPNATRYEQAEGLTERELLDKVRIHLSMSGDPPQKLQQWYAAQQRTMAEQTAFEKQQLDRFQKLSDIQEARRCEAFQMAEKVFNPPKKKNTKPKPPENPYKRRFG